MATILPIIPFPTSIAGTFLSSIALSAAAAVNIAIFSPLFFKWAFPLSDIPGPFSAKWSRWWLWSKLSSGKAEEAFAEVNETYGIRDHVDRPGSLVRIGPNHLITDDAETIKRMLAKDSLYKKGPWFDTLKTNPHHGNIVSERDPEKHNELRKIFNSGILDYGMSSIESAMDKQVANWILDISANHISVLNSTKKLDLSRSISFLALDIMSHICLGRSFDCVRIDEDSHGFLRMIRSNMAIQQFMTVFSEATTALSYISRLPLVGYPFAPSADDGSSVGNVMGLMKKFVFGASRQEPEERMQLEQSLIGRCILRGLPREEADEQGLVLLAAGVDTTSTAIQSILLAIISEVRVYNRLQDEIDEWRAHGTLSNPVLFREAIKLPYLRACIQEGLRMYPPLFQLRERVVPPEGDYICGYRVPGGTFVGLNSLTLQRKEVFGDDTNVFRPERWLISDEAQLRKMAQTSELGFGYGPSKCLGTQIAMIEIHKVVFELFRNFDVAVLNPTRPWKRTSYGVFYQEDFNVRVNHKVNGDMEFISG